MMIGDPKHFAIESKIAQAYWRLSQRALGFFVLHIEGHMFGIRASNATLLASSFDAVRGRIARRGLHRMGTVSTASAVTIAEAFRASRYDAEGAGRGFFGMNAIEFRNAINLSEIVWAPDGDEAFDDGSHILQFDEGERVRIIAFINSTPLSVEPHLVLEKWMDADEYYSILAKWVLSFEKAWNDMEKQ